MKIPIPLKRYLLAMNSSALDAAVHALILFCGMAGGHQLAGVIPTLTGPQLPWVFAIAFGRACLAYLDAHPVTALVEELENSNAKIQTSSRAAGQISGASPAPDA